MKISNSKKQLARIISENGGWRDGAEWAAQDKLAWGSDNLIVLYTNEPSKPKAGGKYWTGKDLGINSSIISNELLTNWYQTKINRDEYLHLYPAPDADGWIAFNGYNKPDFGDLVVEVMLRDGEISGVGPQEVDYWDWSIDGSLRDIISYRPHKPEIAPTEPELNPVSVPDAKPTIEQLAAEYRNRKDYAERKQQEADEAKAEAEAKLAELVAAGKAVGLVIKPLYIKGFAEELAAKSIVDHKRSLEADQEINITDWRDLQVGDVIECTEYDATHRFGRIEAVDAASQS